MAQPAAYSLVMSDTTLLETSFLNHSDALPLVPPQHRSNVSPCSTIMGSVGSLLGKEDKNSNLPVQKVGYNREGLYDNCYDKHIYEDVEMKPAHKTGTLEGKAPPPKIMPFSGKLDKPVYTSSRLDVNDPHPKSLWQNSFTNRKPVLGINVGTDRAITWYGARQPEKGGVPGGDEKFDRLRSVCVDFGSPWPLEPLQENAINDVFACLPTGYEKTEIVKQCRANENGGLTTFLCFVDDEVPETLENRNRFDSRAGARAFLGQTSILGHERRADVHHWVATDRPIATISVGCRTV
ncbi:hypothetical protein Bbelb_293310 [Branchiostoma belcheri]|nr:hypothetical protein Bbelb_293310 [Branchiostoma belcheri]